MQASVLVVEDEEAIALTLGEILRREGYRVDVALDVPEALAKIERGPFDAALLDMRVGEESGLTVLSRLKEKSPRTVAIFLTGFGSLETAIEAMRFGAFDYLLKPCDVETLKATLARGLAKRREDVQLAAENARRELERALHARDDFLAIAAHELKTPLTVVIGWAQYVRRQLARGAAEDAVEKLEVVVDQARRLAGLVETFGDVVQLQDGSLTLTRVGMDLRQLVDQAVRETRAVYPEHTFTVELPERPVPVWVDGTRLRHALCSVIENAAKFSRPGTPVRVCLASAGGEARVAVRDEGIGLTAEELAGLFERFYQADQDVMSRRFGGVGLGLYVTRALVGAHGGRVWAESGGRDQGSTFTIALPLLDDGRPTTEGGEMGRRGDGGIPSPPAGARAAGDGGPG